jgi:hypothetical protein
MSNFIGGSAYAMATQIAEGYLLLNHTHLKKLARGISQRSSTRSTRC